MKKSIVSIIALLFITKLCFGFEIYSQVTGFVQAGKCYYIQTSFYHDNNTTSDVTDDVFLGTDTILHCPEGSYLINGSETGCNLNVLEPSMIDPRKESSKIKFKTNRTSPT